jgi:hypothetical protein
MFGEMGIMITKNKFQGKLKDQETVCMFVGYPPNHACDVYITLNLKKKLIIKSREILWLNNIFEEYDKKVEEVSNILNDKNEDEDEVVEEIRNDPDTPVDESWAKTPVLNKKATRMIESWDIENCWIIEIRKVDDSISMWNRNNDAIRSNGTRKFWWSLWSLWSWFKI